MEETLEGRQAKEIATSENVNFMGLSNKDMKVTIVRTLNLTGLYKTLHGSWE